jgi:hypothetical protein
MRKILAFALLIFSASTFSVEDRAQVNISGPHRKLFPPVACNPPTPTYDAQMWNSSNYCTSGTTACSNGLGLYKVQDSAGSDTATQSTGAQQPIYTTGQVNGLAAAVFTAASSENMGLASSIPYNWTIYSGFAVVKSPVHTDGSNYGILGNSSSGAYWGEFWSSYNSFTFKVSNGSASIYTANSAFPDSTWVMVAFQWNVSTGAYYIWRITGSAVTVLASGTQTATPSGAGYQLNDIGAYGSSSWNNQAIAEVALYNGTISTSALQTYASCKYGF